jgi:hypothetical protein
MDEVKPRTFTQIEYQQIKDVKEYMKSAFDVKSWNQLRNEAKGLWPERIISAVDGLRKWIVKYDKPSKTCTCLGVQF